MSMIQTFFHSVLILAALFLVACETPSKVKNPARAYASTEVLQQKNGSLLVAGDWDYVEFTTTTELPRMIMGGLAAHVALGKARYFHCYEKHVLQLQASDMQETEEDHEVTLEGQRFDRAVLERAAQGDGLNVPLPNSHLSQSFSAAYVRGFLQKVDDVLKNPAGSGAKPLTGPLVKVKMPR
ncbi:MAG: hypothetical protein B7Z37_30495 [Verrucomicrobia bacterium 12-59-8]|nr:MAG: hypothetical protein B7Z37_30495 [Verrucomicrobia bacterium 12-59-8]